MQSATHGRRRFADDDAELAFSGVTLFIGSCIRLLVGDFSEDLVAISDRHCCIGLLAIAQEAKTDARSRFATGNLVDQIVAVLDRTPVDVGDDVAGFQATLIGRTAGLYLLYQYACLESVDAIDCAGEIRTELDTDRSADYLMAGADQVVIDRDNSIRRHSKADALIAVGLREDGCVYANHFAVHVEQRAAGVAGVDCRVGLDEVLKLAARAGLDGTVLGGDDACGHGLRQSKRAADRLN